MRNRASVWVVLAAAVLLSAARAAAAPVEVSVSFFHEQLAPHGRWVTAASYGNVWIPGGVSAGWEPYVDGEWGYSDYGWTWVANDPWGDVPYHYGTWAYVQPYGWAWIPGTVWAPAWVTWAYTDDFIGWAPVPPSFALSVTGYFGPPIVVAASHYVCVPARQFVGVRVASVRVPSQQSITIVQRAVKTTRYEVSNGFVRVAGPPQNKVERAIGRPIQHVTLRAQPTTMAAGGVVKGKTVHVVAPEQERARLTTEKVSAKPSKASKVKPESTSSRNSPEARAKPETRKPEIERERSQPEPKPKADVERSQAPSKPKADVERSQAAAKPKAKPEPRAEPREQSPRESAEPQRPKPEPQVQKHSEPQSSVSREQAAQKQQPKPKSKPQPQPSKEKEKPQKDSPDSRQER